MGNRCRFFLGASLPVLAMIHKDACLVLYLSGNYPVSMKILKSKKRKKYPWPETIVEISVVRDSAFSQAGQLVLTNAKKETIPS